MWQQDWKWLDHDVEVNTEAGKMKTNTRAKPDFNLIAFVIVLKSERLLIMRYETEQKIYI